MPDVAPWRGKCFVGAHPHELLVTGSDRHLRGVAHSTSLVLCLGMGCRVLKMCLPDLQEQDNSFVPAISRFQPKLILWHIFVLISLKLSADSSSQSPLLFRYICTLVLQYPTEYLPASFPDAYYFKHLKLNVLVHSSQFFDSWHWHRALLYGNLI